MVKRGEKSRLQERSPPKLAAGLPCLNPPLSVLDWRYLRPADFSDLYHLDSPLFFNQTKEDEDQRLIVLKEKAGIWTKTRAKHQVLKAWTKRIRSEFRLTEKKILAKAGVEDIPTLFFEFYWRLNHAGPKAALALIGASVHQGRPLRNYTQRPRPTFQKPHSSRPYTRSQASSRAKDPESIDSHRGEGVMSRLPYHLNTYGRDHHLHGWRFNTGPDNGPGFRAPGRANTSHRHEHYNSRPSRPVQSPEVPLSHPSVITPRTPSDMNPGRPSRHLDPGASTRLENSDHHGSHGHHGGWTSSAGNAPTSKPPTPILPQNPVQKRLADVKAEREAKEKKDFEESQQRFKQAEQDRQLAESGAQRLQQLSKMPPQTRSSKQHLSTEFLKGQKITKRKRPTSPAADEEIPGLSVSLRPVTRSSRPSTRPNTTSAHPQKPSDSPEGPTIDKVPFPDGKRPLRKKRVVSPARGGSVAPTSQARPSSRNPSLSPSTTELPIDTRNSPQSGKTKVTTPRNSKSTKRKKREEPLVSPPPSPQRPSEHSLPGPSDTIGDVSETLPEAVDFPLPVSTKEDCPPNSSGTRKRKRRRSVSQASLSELSPPDASNTVTETPQSGRTDLPTTSVLKPFKSLPKNLKFTKTVERVEAEPVATPEELVLPASSPHPSFGITFPSVLPASTSDPTVVGTVSKLVAEEDDGEPLSTKLEDGEIIEDLSTIPPGLLRPQSPHAMEELPANMVVDSPDEVHMGSGDNEVEPVSFEEDEEDEEMVLFEDLEESLEGPLFSLPTLDRDIPHIVRPLVTVLDEPPESNFHVYRPSATLARLPTNLGRVCETFEWFRSYQGGVYFSNDIVKGYLLSAFGAKTHRRDVFKHDGRLIISHGGGRAESVHSEKGRLTVRPAEDQRSDDKSVRALLKTYRERRPIVLIIDDRYAKFPYDLASKGVTYAVLGFYMIVNAWAELQPDEKSGRTIVKYKFAFQWCEGQGDPWWISESGMSQTGFRPSALAVTNILQKSLPRAGHVCIQSCSKFWQIHPFHKGGGPDRPKDIITEQSSEAERHDERTDVKPEDPEPEAAPKYLPGYLTYNEEFLELRDPCPLPIGLRNSPASTRQSARRRCYHFSCFHTRVPLRKVWPNVLQYSRLRRVKEQTLARVFYDESGAAAGRISTYVLPENRGFLHQIQPMSKDVADATADADRIFQTYQQEANDWKSSLQTLADARSRGALLTNYFSHNDIHLEAQYVGGTDNTVPFDKAPSAVVQARALIQKRITQALGRKAEFNEVLTAAYMEKQKMAAGLSLGSPAFMHFRLQRKHDRERLQKGILMSFILRHGDVFVMDGLGRAEILRVRMPPASLA
ncbi:hypothetical protein DFP72DRAFT_843792 [Ephemerocybe angulata]|uniref:Uncharacterized protein n=1 Tax=Ephemerocybe angulata TaxID=980116 RepID=A0A8H6I7H3_9AGAR|nr:hypothetical protein DFP72DRAFT_843792 [Tulosesus angulatus]